MVREELYQNIVKRMMELRSEEDLKKNDFVIMLYLLGVLNNTEPTEIKQSRIVEFTGLSKSDVSKSINRLISQEILSRVDDDFKFGLKINNISN
ncbi:MarR family transcriptional regulator [Clostridium botulinum]|nr:MarR family transcriptional regulator [Clostridium botulinum]NFN20805.1 MarR family transcriptional regulator [Clostridium botulinum]NFN42023.1 MarR family transcriptional regulator [Clostridium botulinum]